MRSRLLWGVLVSSAIFNVLNLVFSILGFGFWGVLAALMVGALIFIAFITISFTPQRDHVPPEDERPHLPPSQPFPFPPTQEEKHTEPALLVTELNFIIRGNGGKRFGNRAFEHDIGIRPYAKIEVNDDQVIGKQAILRFTISGPRRRSRYDWTVDVPFTIAKGLNRIWPEQEEFSIAGQERQLGSWALELRLVGEDGYSSRLEETTFVIRSSTEHPVRVGPDASISKREIEEIAEDRGIQTIDDVLEDW